MSGLFGWLADYIVAAASAVMGWISALWNLISTTVGQWATEAVTWLLQQLPLSQIGSLFSSPLLNANLKNALSALTYFFPVVGVMAIITMAYSICATIRLLRWVKSFIPTISGA